MAAAEDITLGKLLLAEYDRLKEEQKTRIGFRDNLLYVTMAAIVSVLIGAANTRHPVLLVVLPAAVCALGWTYLVNDEKISAIGRYIRTELGPRLGTLVDAGHSPFGWEAAHRQDSRRTQRKRIQCAVDLAVFTATPATALIVYWARGPLASIPLAVSVLEAIAVLILAFQIIAHADTRP
ncbi:hypothetical protein [Streptomyces sp. ODS28]|uniref:hypothetical protein n=1 Tax=Streptomyces sp. ODS28 TaxID=3136688 RepID=UPI0031EE0EE6